MTNDKTKINIHSTTLRNRMRCIETEQDTVFELAAKPHLRRPYGRYRQKRATSAKQVKTSSTPRLSPTQIQGQKYEEQAISFLQSQGLVLIAKNLRCKLGEIDCVMRHHHTLVFVEVRQRSQSYYGSAAASIDQYKQRRIKQTANYFLPKLCQHLALKEIPPCRFDVLSFDGQEPEFQWLKHAFT